VSKNGHCARTQTTVYAGTVHESVRTRQFSNERAAMITVIRHYEMVHKRLPPWRPLVPNNGMCELFVSDTSVLVDRHNQPMSEPFEKIICLRGPIARQAVLNSIDDGNVRGILDFVDSELGVDENDTERVFVALGVNIERLSEDSSKMARARAVLLAGDLVVDDAGIILQRLQCIIDGDAATDDEPMECEDGDGLDAFDDDSNDDRRAACAAAGNRLHFTDISSDQHLAISLGAEQVSVNSRAPSAIIIWHILQSSDDGRHVPYMSVVDIQRVAEEYNKSGIDLSAKLATCTGAHCGAHINRLCLDYHSY
jgi:hypothetical protein